MDASRKLCCGPQEGRLHAENKNRRFGDPSDFFLVQGMRSLTLDREDDDSPDRSWAKALGLAGDSIPGMCWKCEIFKLYLSQTLYILYFLFLILFDGLLNKD